MRLELDGCISLTEVRGVYNWGQSELAEVGGASPSSLKLGGGGGGYSWGESGLAEVGGGGIVGASPGSLKLGGIVGASSSLGRGV